MTAPLTRDGLYREIASELREAGMPVTPRNIALIACAAAVDALALCRLNATGSSRVVVRHPGEL